MKRINVILVAILIIMTGCGGQKQSDNQNDEYITVDVNTNYPKKELILQDFMDVEYIPLETNDEFLCQGQVLDVGKKFMLLRNNNRDGNIFVYNRNGKAITIINRMGQSGYDYVSFSEAILDEDNNEMFVNDNSKTNILVYDLNGNYKRSFMHADSARYQNLYNYDRDNLICYDGRIIISESNVSKRKSQSFYIISKHDGSIVKKIEFDFEEEKTTMIIVREGNMTMGVSFGVNQITPHKDDWILMTPSSDTIFRLLPDYSKEPFIIRTPSIQSMNPEVFLNPCILTDKYYFMESTKKEFGFEKMTGFPKVHLMYDRKEKAIFEYTILNNDFTIKWTEMPSKTLNNEIAFWKTFETFSLIEANEKGELQGKLKEIAADLDEDDNPVIMLVKYKK